MACRIAESVRCSALYVAPGNAGTARVNKCCNVDVDPLDFEALRAVVHRHDIDMLVVGPEAPLVAGVTDFFAANSDLRNVMVVGPGRAGAQLEGSKDFAKQFMQRHGIPTAAYRSFAASEAAEGEAFLGSLQAPYVLKADGLAAGKGVLILDSLDEARHELRAMLEGKFGQASAKVVVEQYLDGVELSVFVLTDGKHYKILPTAKDYKRIGEGDTGLNTGGMGSVSPVHFADRRFMQKVEERIVAPTVRGLSRDGIPYKGFIFVGLMAVADRATGELDPYVIEYNVRMGDPETEAVMTRIEGDFADLLYACADGCIDKVHYAKSAKTAVTVMLVSGGYPEAYQKGKVMTGMDQLKDCVAFHAGTGFNADGQVITAGGRVIAVTAHGNSIMEAREKAYQNVEKIKFEGENHRHDIGLDLV